MNVTEINISRTTATTNVQEKIPNDQRFTTITSTAGQPITQDGVSLSYNGHTVGSLTERALQTSPSRAEKIEALKQTVAGAQYQLDSAKIAEALVNTGI